MTPGHVPTHLCLGGSIYNFTVLQRPEDSDSLSMTQLALHPGSRSVILNSYGLGCMESRRRWILRNVTDLDLHKRGGFFLHS